MSDPMTQLNVICLRDVRDNVTAWVRARLWAQVLVGLVLGLVVGVLLGPDVGWLSPETGETVGAWLAIPGRVFLGLISLVLIPLVVVSIVEGITGAGSGAALRRLGGRLLLFVVLTTALASTLGVSIAFLMKPGELLKSSLETNTETVLAVSEEIDTPAGTSEEGDGEVKQRMLDRLPDLIVEMLPTNAHQVFSERDMLAVVIIAVLLGIACLSAGVDHVQPLLEVLGALLEISMIIIKWAMFLAPLAVFGLIAQLVIQVGFGTIASLASYAGAVFLGLIILFLTFLGLVAIFSPISVGRFCAAIAPVQLMVFSTSSTTAVMPLSIETLVSKLDVRPETANLIIPLAATINMAGTALYQSIAIIFLAQAAGYDLSLATTAGVVIAVVAASVGAPGTPGVGVVLLANIAATAGIPAIGLPLVLGLDRPLDMARSAVNVTGDLAACVIVDSDPPNETEPPE